eukprot:SAG22_NODE_3078_length_1958_cov_1.454008_1_plen_140_part_00
MQSHREAHAGEDQDGVPLLRSTEDQGIFGADGSSAVRLDIRVCLLWKPPPATEQKRCVLSASQYQLPSRQAVDGVAALRSEPGNLLEDGVVQLEDEKNRERVEADAQGIASPKPYHSGNCHCHHYDDKQARKNMRDDQE